ncbi:MAG TPA: hypothetical protein VFI25_07670 [Planctomycetota bacterium]|jgi:hypothetical protein|nr:hypothetical protein [Planctomycetota bacterium]
MLERIARRARPLAAVSAAILVAGAAAATTVQKLDFAGLTRHATHVVVGKVGAGEAAFTPDGGAVMTSTQLTVAGEWKGSTGSKSIVVRTPGGKVGDFVMEVAGSPNLRPGDTALLFLERNPDGTYGVISLAQGSFRVLSGPDGTLLVERDPEAKHLIAVGGRSPGRVEVVRAPFLAVQTEVERAARAKPPEEGEAEESETIVPVSDVKAGGGR